MDQNYQIIKLTNKISRDLSAKYHYLHSKPSNIKQSFGLLDSKNNLIGFCVFGVPHSHTLLSGIAGKTFKNRILELKRLWIDDSAPRNTESWFISRCLKSVRCAYVVSFTDPNYGHVGYVYQATNWIYTGKSNDRRVLVPKNLNGRHPPSLTYGKTKSDLIKEYGTEALEYIEVSGKHRYIYIPKRGKTHKKLLSKLKYKQETYPKL